jgi:hypothetical protein
MTPEADDDTMHIVEEGGEFFCVRQGCGTRRGPFQTKTAALDAAYVLTGLIDQNPSHIPLSKSPQRPATSEAERK